MGIRPQLKIAMLGLAALALASGDAQAQGPEVVSSIYICANYTGTALTTAQFNTSSCAATGGVIIKGKLTGYSFEPSRNSNPPGSVALGPFTVIRSVLDPTGINLQESILSGNSLGTIVIGVNSKTGSNETNQFTFVLKGAALQSESQGVSSTGPEEAFGLTFTSMTVYDNVTGSVVTYAAPASATSASIKRSQHFAGRVQ